MTIYRLKANEPERSIELRGFGDNLLHLLDDRGALMVGNGGWSYTLSKHGGAELGAPPRLERLHTVDSRAAGVFDGRTPCRRLADRVRVRPGSDWYEAQVAADSLRGSRN